MTLNGFEALFIRLDWTNVFAFWKAIIKFLQSALLQSTCTCSS
jgi:hypothetical protein